MEYEKVERAKVLKEAVEMYKRNVWNDEEDEQIEVVKSPGAWAPPPVRT